MSTAASLLTLLIWLAAKLAIMAHPLMSRGGGTSSGAGRECT
jgi:hypothetical protein